MFLHRHTAIVFVRFLSTLFTDPTFALVLKHVFYVCKGAVQDNAYIDRRPYISIQAGIGETKIPPWL